MSILTTYYASIFFPFQTKKTKEIIKMKKKNDRHGSLLYAAVDNGTEGESEWKGRNNIIIEFFFFRVRFAHFISCCCLHLHSSRFFLSFSWWFGFVSFEYSNTEEEDREQGAKKKLCFVCTSQHTKISFVIIYVKWETTRWCRLGGGMGWFFFSWGRTKNV